MRKIANTILLLCSLFISTLVTAQDNDFEDNNIFRTYLGWDIRAGGEKHTSVSERIDLTNGQSLGSGSSEYKNSRVTIDLLNVDWSEQLFHIKRFKVGYVLGFNAGFSPQHSSNSSTNSGTLYNSGFPSVYGGNQGDLGSDNFTISMELKAGGGLAYEINAKNNFQISLGYSFRYWTKGNMGFYALPKFFGGFFEANLTYKNWYLYSTYRSRAVPMDYPNGNVKVSYVSFLPTYSFPNAKFNSLGIRFEFARARANNSSTTSNIEENYRLKANSFLIGIYGAFAF